MDTQMYPDQAKNDEAIRELAQLNKAWREFVFGLSVEEQPQTQVEANELFIAFEAQYNS